MNWRDINPHMTRFWGGPCMSDVVAPQNDKPRPSVRRPLPVVTVIPPTPQTESVFGFCSRDEWAHLEALGHPIIR